MKKKAKKVEFTAEHLAFLCMHFPDMSINWMHTITKDEKTIKCVEIRGRKEIIACGISIENQLSFSAVSKEERGSGYQVELINKRVAILKEEGQTCVWATVRCKNRYSLSNLLKCKFSIVSVIFYEDLQMGYEMRLDL